MKSINRVEQTLIKLLSAKSYYTILKSELVLCNICDFTIRVPARNPSWCISSHEKSQRHSKGLELWKTSRKQRQLALTEQTNHQHNAFNQALTRMLVSCNSPIHKVYLKPFKEFVLNYCGRSCPEESTLRKYYVGTEYRKNIENVRKAIGADWIFIQVDEAIVNSRSIYSVLVGALNGSAPKIYLLDVAEIEEASNNRTVIQTVNSALNILWPDSPHYERLRLLISDQASHMLKASEILQAGLYPKLIHVTCLCHALSRVCEHVKCLYPNVDRLIKYLNNLLVRSPRRVKILEHKTGGKMPSLPVATQWATWIVFANWVCLNFDAIKEFAHELHEDEAASVKELRQEILGDRIEQDLLNFPNLQCLPEAIKKLQTRGLTIFEQRNIIDSLGAKIPNALQAKLNDSLRKNPAYSQIFEHGDQQTNLNYLYAPLSSADVERSFSMMKPMLTDNRQRLTPENFKQLIVSYYNAYVE